MTIKEKKEKQDRNREYKKLIKDQFKKINDYLTGNLKEKKVSREELEKTVSETQKILDKAKDKKVIHRNKGRRRKSWLHKKLNELGKPAEIE